MPDISEFCPACGRPVREGSFFPPDADVEHAATRAGVESGEAAPAVTRPPVDWEDRLIGAAAYLTFIPAVLLLFLKQYQQREFVRFHAFQSVFFWALVVVLGLLGLLASLFGWLFMWLLIGTVISLALFFTWLLLSIKALQGERFELPWLGPLAEQQAAR